MQSFQGVSSGLCVPVCVPLCVRVLGPGGHTGEEMVRAWQTKSPLWDAQWHRPWRSPCGGLLMAGAV